jgi:Flp pilus assembly CpaE family ATPase
VEPVLVVNQVRRGPVPGDARAEIAAALERFAGRAVGVFLPADRRATDAALAAGRTLAEVAAGSPLRTAMRSFAASLGGVDDPAVAGRRRGPGRRRAG